ncbi:MAG: hypothetical protein IE909_08095 [Campylobacterales bacterium]|nr:hypothetical protein [Campylobacterales bacterium]
MILNKKNLAKLLVVSSLLAGCNSNMPGTPNFEKDADQYFESKNYLKAIEYYEKGLKQSPNDTDLKAKLQNAKKVYVQFKVAQLDQKLSNAQVNMMLIDSLQQELNNLKLYGSFEQIQAFENKLNSLKNNIENELASLKKQVFDYKENKEYEKLLDKLQAMVTLDEKVKTSDFYLSYFNQSVNYYYDETMSDLNSGELDEASKNYRVFKSYSSDTVKIESLQKSIEDYKKVDSLITLVESNLIQENLDEALKNSVELIALKVSNKSLTQRATQVTSKVTKELECMIISK